MEELVVLADDDIGGAGDGAADVGNWPGVSLKDAFVAELYSSLLLVDSSHSFKCVLLLLRLTTSTILSLEISSLLFSTSVICLVTAPGSEVESSTLSVGPEVDFSSVAMVADLTPAVSASPSS